MGEPSNPESLPPRATEWIGGRGAELREIWVHPDAHLPRSATTKLCPAGCAKSNCLRMHAHLSTLVGHGQAQNTPRDVFAFGLRMPREVRDHALRGLGRGL